MRGEGVKTAFQSVWLRKERPDEEELFSNKNASITHRLRGGSGGGKG